MKSPYSRKILDTHLTDEKKHLKRWNEIVDTSDDELLVRMAKGNIPSCEARIEDLEHGILLIDMNYEP